ncbi:MAG: sulfite exporter TauE/SafE family protein [Melioribacteraceae bacterium]|nr:sulfite exporter TauE/SafE family protein [Melioribacteraceae bacterium]
MADYSQLFLLFFFGMLAGFINVNAGGGSTLTLPMLIFLGLDGAVANGTNRIGIFFQNLSAIFSFKNQKHSQFKLSFKLALFTLPGAIIGAYFAANISNQMFEKILAIVMIGVIITLVLPRKSITAVANPTRKQNFFVYLAMFGIGFYGGFIQVGVGFLLMASLHYLMKQSLVYVNMHKVFIVLIYTIPALLIFIYSDNVDWGFGLTLASGNMIGAWWGAKFSIKGGEKYIKIILIIAVSLMSLKLFGLF